MMNILIISGVLVAALIVFGLGWFICKGFYDKKHLKEIEALSKGHTVDKGVVQTKLNDALEEGKKAADNHQAKLSELNESHEKALADAVAAADQKHLELFDQRVGELKEANARELSQAVNEASSDAKAKGYAEGRAEALGNPVPFAELRKGTYMVEKSITVGHAHYGLGITETGAPILINLAGAQGDVPMKIAVGQGVVCSSVADRDVFLVMLPELPIIPKPAASPAQPPTEASSPGPSAGGPQV